MMRLSPLAFASLFSTGTVTLSPGTFDHVGAFENLPQKLVFADSQRGNLFPATVITISIIPMRGDLVKGIMNYFEKKLAGCNF